MGKKTQLDRIESELREIRSFLEGLGLGQNPRRTISEIDDQVRGKVLKLTRRKR